MKKRSHHDHNSLQKLIKTLNDVKSLAENNKKLIDKLIKGQSVVKIELDPVFDKKIMFLELNRRLN
jgi:predicted RNA-binding protein with PIN domain